MITSKKVYTYWSITLACVVCSQKRSRIYKEYCIRDLSKTIHKQKSEINKLLSIRLDQVRQNFICCICEKKSKKDLKKNQKKL